MDLVKTLTFVITGLMCGVAALIYASRMTAVAAASAGSAYEMDAIAAVAIGGTSMSGGRGKIVGTFAGVLMFKIISNILTAADVSHLPQRRHQRRDHRHRGAAAKLPEPETVNTQLDLKGSVHYA